MKIAIPGYDGYTISDIDFTIYGKKGNPLQETIDAHGYVRVRINGIPTAKHRLVAITFIPNPDNLPEVNHKDTDKMHNYPSNLEWCTKQYNIKHAYDTGCISHDHLSDIAHNSTGGRRTAELHSIPILQLNIDGNIIGKYNGIREASKLTGIQSSGITRCCKGEYKQYRGYIWRYNNENSGQR